MDAIDTSDSKQKQRLFEDIQEHSIELKGTYGIRDQYLDLYDQAYLMEWDRADDQAWKEIDAEVVQSPEARNVVLGAMRLMVANDPHFKCSSHQEDANLDDIEAAIDQIWTQSGRVQKKPIHYDQMLSSILYGEIHTAITPMSTLIKRTKDTQRLARLTRLAKFAPYLIESWSPRGGYPEYGRWGLLEGYYREVDTTASQLIADFGDAVGQDILGMRRYQTVTLKTFYDPKYACFWTDSGMLALDEHGWPEIPIQCTLTDGSRLFPKPEDQAQPLLYTMIKSGLWNEQNLAMTVIYTMVFALGTSPMFVHVNSQNSVGKPLNINFDEMAGIVELEAGEQLNVLLNKNIIDPSLMDAYRLAVSKGQESTIYPQALGAPLSGSGATTFSELNLLSQSGRLPLTGPQKQGGQHIASVIELMLMMMKADGENFPKSTGIKLSDIPSDLQVEAELDVKLPQDKLQLANIANILKNAGLVDDEWIQSNILGITNSKAIKQKVWDQNAETAMYQYTLQRLIAKIQQQDQASDAAEMAQQQGQQPGQQQPQGPGGPQQPMPQQPPNPNQQPMQPPGAPGQPTPDQMQQLMAAQQQGQGLPPGAPTGPGPQMPTGPTPVQGMPQAQAGILPGPGQGELPPGMPPNGRPMRRLR